MATSSIYCSQVRGWDYQDEAWKSFSGRSYNGYSNLCFIGWIPQVIIDQVYEFTPGIQMYSFGAIPAGAVITSATLNFKSVCYTGSYTSNVRLRVSGTYEAYTTTEPSDYQQSAVNFTTTLTNRSIDITNQIQSYATAGSPFYIYLYEPSSEFVGPMIQDIQGIVGTTPYVSITYTVTTACTAPTSVSVSNSTPAPSSSVALSWSGATGGTNNAITGYDVYRSTSSGGTYTLLDSVTTSNTYGSLSVTSHSSVGSSYYYKIKTKGTAGVSYYSNFSTSVEVTSTATACSAPTSVSVSNSAPNISTSVTLSWSGASGGTNNSITGYKIYRSTSSGGTYSALTGNTRDITTSSSSGSYSVTSPSSYGSSYYYKLVTVGTVSGYNSSLSSANAGITSTLTTSTTAPTSVSVDVSTLEPSSMAVVSWSGAGAGSNNTISGYLVCRDTSSSGSFSLIVADVGESSSSAEVYSSPIAGDTYYYRVITKGVAGTAYYSPLSTAYTQITSTQNAASCSPPSTVSISNDAPEPIESLTISWSGAAEGSGNPITGYEIYSSDTDVGGYDTLVGSVSTSGTSGSFSPIIASSDYGVTKYFRIKTIGTLSNHDSGLSSSVFYKTYLYANYSLSIPTLATLPVAIQYIVIYYNNTSVYKELDNTLLDVVQKERILPCSGVYNSGSVHKYILSAYSDVAYVFANGARALTESEQDYYLKNGTVKTQYVTKQWDGEGWRAPTTSNTSSWSQTASSEIIQTADEISQKVTKGTIISEINQTAEAVTISASKINFNGIVTANQNFKILSDGSMEAKNGKFSGDLTAENTYCNNLLLRSGKEMTVGLWKIGSNGIYYPSGQGFNYLAMLYHGETAYLTAYAPMYLGPDKTHPLYVTGNGITFTITNNDYSASFAQDYYMNGEQIVYYQEVCLICDQAGNTYDLAKGNIGTQTHRWDVLWVDTAHYRDHPSDSSKTKKHDIKPIRETGELIDSLEPVEFVYNDDSSEKVRFGLIYEDTIDKLPEICTEDEKTGDLGITYEPLNTILLKEVQELRKRVKELEEKNTSYEERLIRLEALIV